MTAPPVRGLLLAATTFTLGLLCGPWGPEPLPRLLLAVLLFLVVLFFRRTRNFQPYSAITILLLWFALGWSRGVPPRDPHLPTGTAWIEGEVGLPVEHHASFDRIRVNNLRWRLGREGGVLDGGAWLLLSGAKRRPIEAGDHLLLAGQISRLRGARNPGGFDARAYGAVRGLRFSIDHVERVEVRRGQSFAARVDRLYGGARRGIAAIVSREGNARTLPLARALLLGDRSSWDRGQRDRFARSGLMHLFAISGLHIGLLLLLLRHLLTLLRVPHRTTLFVAVFLLWAMLPLVGANPPAVRAAVMLSFLALGTLLQRRNRPSWSLLLAYLALLAWRPEGLHDAGFQLSFAGAAGAVFAANTFDELQAAATSRRIAGWGHRIKTWSAKVYYAFVISVGAWAATAPFVIWHFGRLPWLAPAATLLALPLITLALAAGWLAVLVAPFAWLSAIFSSALHALLELLLLISQHGATGFPLAEHLPSSAIAAALLAAGVLAFLARRIALAPLAGWTLAILSVAVIAVYSGFWATSQQSLLMVVDVGQGDGILLKRGERAVLIDGGRRQEHAVSEQIRLAGIQRLDLVLLTHGDGDHAGALADLARQVPIGAALIGPGTLRDRAGRIAIDSLRAHGVPVYLGGRGVRADLGKLGELTLLAPDEQDIASLSSRDNDLSLVSLWTIDGAMALFPGDATDREERSILKDGGVPDIDLLVAGHHGSRHSSSAAWLSALRPEIAAISCGSDNPYGHPAPELLARLHSHGCQTFRTDREGALLFRPAGDGFRRVSPGSWW